jgi:hypothetical protein
MRRRWLEDNGPIVVLSILAAIIGALLIWYA